MRLTYAIVLVSDMERSVAFYRDVVGMELRFQAPGWAEFATEGATLALHASEGTASPPGTCRPGVRVPDLDAFHRRMVEQGVPCVEEPEEVYGTRVAQYRDPDGLPFSVAEERHA
jgi:lactoylglutathione lyase